VTKPRPKDVGGVVFHVMNRAVIGQVLFTGPADYDAFMALARRAQRRTKIRILAYCLMPNHWHFAVWVEHDAQLRAFIGWLSTVHAMHVRTWTGTRGRGAVYQDRYLAVPVEAETYYYRLIRYIERNAARAGLVDRPEEWPWGSAAALGGVDDIGLAEWPVDRPSHWLDFINDEDTVTDLALIRARTQARQAITRQRLGVEKLAVPMRDGRRRNRR
jgi:putative transposase